MADREQVAREMRERDSKTLERSHQEYSERMKGRPTPSQEECDLAKLGASVLNKRDDGSGPDFVYGVRQRNVEAQPASAQSGGGYQTRASRPAPSSPPPQPEAPRHREPRNPEPPKTE